MFNSVNVEINGGTAIIHLAGEVDVNLLSTVETALKPVVENRAITNVVLDCSQLQFIDSKIVGYIAYLRTTLGKTGRSLALAAVNETVNDILSLVGLTQVIPHFDTLPAALNQPVA